MTEISDRLHSMLYSVPKGSLEGVNLIAFGQPFSSLHQYFRANKNMGHFKNHEHGIYTENGAENILNNFWAAVTAYHHVRDWAFKDPEAMKLEKDWKQVVFSDQWLRYAMNLANASKHSDLDYNVAEWPPVLRCRYDGLIHTLSDFYRTLELKIAGEILHPADFLDNVARAWSRELQNPLLEQMSKNKRVE